MPIIMPTRRRNYSSANERFANALATDAATTSGPASTNPNDTAPALIHFEGDWPFRERLWLRQRVREAERTVKRVFRVEEQSDAAGQSLLYGARWLAQRSALDGGGVRLTVHRQGTGQVLVGASLGQIDGQISRLPLIERS